MKKLLFILIILAALGGGGWWWWQNRKPEDVTYQTSPVTRGDITQMVTATGTLNPVLNVQVGSQISGNIKKLNVDYNSTVTAGQVTWPMPRLRLNLPSSMPNARRNSARRTSRHSPASTRRLLRFIKRRRS